MGEISAIAWTDATFNPWIGCTKVSQGCKLCYAETQNNRFKWNPAGWGPGAQRKRTSESYWKKPIQWAKQAAADGVIRRVFCASLADVFDAEAPQEWRADLWELINVTANIGGLEWLILTKRPENIERMIPWRWQHLPPDCVRIGFTAEDQENYCRRYNQFIMAWKGKNFVSYEPALGPLVIGPNFKTEQKVHDRIDWFICGGESGAGCRPFDIEWALDLKTQCKAADIPFFMKQLGGHPDKRHNPEDWPHDLRIREFPE
jgi:protein gp37